MDKGVELLVEDHEIALLHLLAARRPDQAVAEKSFAANGVDVKALFAEALPQVRFRAGALCLLEDSAPLIGQFDNKFRHTVD